MKSNPCQKDPIEDTLGVSALMSATYVLQWQSTMRPAHVSASIGWIRLAGPSPTCKVGARSCAPARKTPMTNNKSTQAAPVPARPTSGKLNKQAVGSQSVTPQGKVSVKPLG